jgi:hypothetical protein
MGEPRTWRIDNAPEDDWIGDGPLLLPGEGPVRVIEAAPLLDLLERLRRDVGMREPYQECWGDGTIAKVDALLRAHGRSAVD